MTRKTTSAAKMALLGQIDLFAECTKKELAQIASITTEYDAEAGQVLAQEGRPGGEFFIIVDGQATASRNNVVLAKLSCTDFFGELALLDGDRGPPPSRPTRTCTSSSFRGESSVNSAGPIRR